MLTIRVESETIDPDDGHVIVKHGKLVFVDLAGNKQRRWLVGWLVGGDQSKQHAQRTPTVYYMAQAASG